MKVSGKTFIIYDLIEVVNNAPELRARIELTRTSGGTVHGYLSQNGEKKHSHVRVRVGPWDQEARAVEHLLKTERVQGQYGKVPRAAQKLKAVAEHYGWLMHPIRIG